MSAVLSECLIAFALHCFTRKPSASPTSFTCLTGEAVGVTYDEMSQLGLAHVPVAALLTCD